MAYSIIEQSSLDLDIFFKDEDKIIHLASAGGILPKQLLNSDVYNNRLLNTILTDYSFEFQYELNPNLVEILAINQDELENYTKTFIEMAKKGFYSYDKTVLGDFTDQTFHLVARPVISSLRPYKILDNFELLNASKILPNDYLTFNLFEHFQ